MHVDSSRLVKPDPGKLISAGTRGTPLGQKYSGWHQGAALPIPTTRLYGASARLRDELMALHERGSRHSNIVFDERYGKLTFLTRELLSKIFGHDTFAVIFEDTGSSAIAFAYNLLGIKNHETVLTTTFGAPLFEHIVAGQDPKTHSMYIPQSVGLFSQAAPVASEAKATKVEYVDIYDGNRSISDEEILESIASKLSDPSIRLVFLPQVTRTGRELPWKNIGDLVKKENERRLRISQQNGKPYKRIWYMVDAIQAIGRVSYTNQFRPLDHCDFYIITGSKALGALPTTGVIFVRKDTINSLINNLLDSPFRSYFKFDQFPRDFIPPCLADYLERECNVAISLPELLSFYRALKLYFANTNNDQCSYTGENLSYLGIPASYDVRKRSLPDFAKDMDRRIRRMQEMHDQLATCLSSIPGVTFVAGSSAAPITPSILVFHSDKFPSGELKGKLRERNLTVGGVGQFIRVDFPAYTTPRPIEPLVEAIRTLHQS